MEDLISKIQRHKETFFDGQGIRTQKYNPRWAGTVYSKVIFQLIHFGTPILQINLRIQKPKILPGIRGSVSDIRGINQCLQAFNLHYKYSSTKGLQKLTD